MNVVSTPMHLFDSINQSLFPDEQVYVLKNMTRSLTVRMHKLNKCMRLLKEQKLDHLLVAAYALIYQQ